MAARVGRIARRERLFTCAILQGAVRATGERSDAGAKRSQTRATNPSCFDLRRLRCLAAICDATEGAHSGTAGAGLCRLVRAEGPGGAVVRNRVNVKLGGRPKRAATDLLAVALPRPSF